MTELANLRYARIRCHKKLRQTEALLAGYKTKLAEIEVTIYSIGPELKLPLQHRQYNQVFKRGEYTRIALVVLREAEGSLPLREIALKALAAKGIRVALGAAETEPEPVRHGSQPVRTREFQEEVIQIMNRPRTGAQPGAARTHVVVGETRRMLRP
jgi:hypothetical protein